MKSIALLSILAISCTSLNHERPAPSYHKPSDAKLNQYSGKSRILPIKSGDEALIARVRAIRDSSHSIDLQYYIWKDDSSGMLLLKELITAANRGVRVRLLLDNFYESRFSKGMKIIDLNPMIEVRLIDTNFKYFNRRMHNKSLTVDNQVSIIGGRNIGNEYFEISKESNFKDYDVLLAGPVVEEVSDQFDEFWNSKRSLPPALIEKNPIEHRELEKARTRLASVEAYSIPSPDPLEKMTPYWSEAHIFYDPPSKLMGKDKENLTSKLRPGILGIEKELILISPYFIPGRKGMKTLKNLRERNIRVVVLTNSLLSSDVMPVYGGYRKYREDLLKMGVELYEMKASGLPKKQNSIGSSGNTGLHGKVVIADRQKLFVGSMNLDPRSKDLNTEMGVVIKDEKMANDHAQELFNTLPEISYRLEYLKGNLYWHEKTPAGEKRHSTEPGVTRWKNFKVNFSSWVIPEQML